MKLLILRGVPGCGKSTVAASTGYKVANRDSLRESILGHAEDFSNESLITEVQNLLIEEWVHRGYDVCVDNTNIRWNYVADIAEIGKRYGAEIEIKVIDVGLDEALRRNAERGRLGGRQVPDHIIRRMYDELEISKDWTL